MKILTTVESSDIEIVKTNPYDYSIKININIGDFKQVTDAFEILLKESYIGYRLDESLCSKLTEHMVQFLNLILNMQYV